jgi:hypothetical protein
MRTSIIFRNTVFALRNNAALATVSDRHHQPHRTSGFTSHVRLSMDLADIAYFLCSKIHFIHIIYCIIPYTHNKRRVHYRIHKTPQPFPTSARWIQFTHSTPVSLRSISIRMSHLRPGLPSCLYHSGILIAPMRARSPAHLILLKFTIKKVKWSRYAL